MERKILNMLSLALSLMLVGCSANPAPDGKEVKASNTAQVAEDIYNKPGMEISKIVSNMADTLHKTMMADLSKEENLTHSYTDEEGRVVKYSTVPKVAVTSFVDTDTYEDAGYLGRTMAEMFVHELDRRGISVFEYKLTGAISITKDGEFVFSRNWKKVARQAMVRHIVAGTISRNDKGVVIVGRIINMQNSTVVGSTTNFIPYELLPYCYRTAQKNCSINGVSSYLYQPGNLVVDGKVKDTVVKRTVTVTNAKVRASSATIRQGNAVALSEKDRQKLKEQKFKDNYYSVGTDEFNSKYYVKGAVVPATSTGNYEKYMDERQNSFFRFGANSSVIYPADTYMYDKKLVRDVHDQSQYSRTTQ